MLCYNTNEVCSKMSYINRGRCSHADTADILVCATIYDYYMSLALEKIVKFQLRARAIINLTPHPGASAGMQRPHSDCALGGSQV